MALIICPECRNNVSDKTDKCPHCGYPIYMKVNMTMGTVTCQHCGSTNEAYNTSCSQCGAPLEKDTQKEATTAIPNVSYSQNVAPNIPNASVINIVVPNIPNNAVPKNKWIALCLCLCFGYFGAHKFYEGKIKRGILFLFTFGLFGIGWLVDFFTILGKPNPYYVK